MIAVSFLGCYAAKKNKKTYLCCYIVCVIVILMIQIAAAVVMINYSNSFKSAFSVNSAALTARSDVDLNDAVLSLYTRCCSGCPGTDPAVNQCNNPNAYFPGVSTYCYNRPNGAGGTITCSQVQSCTAAVTSYCYVYLPGDPLLRPTHNIDPTLCTLLSTLNGANGPIVGYVDKGGCGAGQVSTFVSNLDDYFSPKLYLVGVGFAVIAFIQSTVVFVGIYVILCASHKDIEEEYSIEDAYERRLRRI